MKIQNILVSLSIIFTVQLGLGHPVGTDRVRFIPRGSRVQLLSPINILPHTLSKSQIVRVRGFDYSCYMNVIESSLDDRTIMPRTTKIVPTEGSDFLVSTKGVTAFEFKAADKTISSISCDLSYTDKGTGDYNDRYIDPKPEEVPGFGSIELMRELLKESFNIELMIEPPVEASLDDQMGAS